MFVPPVHSRKWDHCGMSVFFGGERMRIAPTKQILVVVPVLFVWLLISSFTYFWLVPQQNNFDFYSNWVGAHEMLRGENPYATQYTDEYLQARGYPMLVHRVFKYPATIVWVLLPFWLLPPDVAVSLWCGLQLLMVMIFPLLVFNLLNWRVRPGLVLVVFLASLVGNYHTVNVYVLGQFTVFVLASMIVAWWSIVKGYSWLAALALFSATIRPEGVFMAGVVLLDLLLARRYRTVIEWVVVTGVVFLVTFLQVGFWIPYIFRAAARYHYVSQVSSYPPEALKIDLLVPVIVIIAVVWGLLMFWQTRDLPDRTRLVWRISAALLTFLVVLPQTHDYTLVYTFLPIWFLMWAGRHSAWTLPLLITLLLASWAVYFIGGATLARLQQLITPVVLAGVLTYYWYRIGRQTGNVHELAAI